jgi:acetyltransferase-like isoleucine patch superfamily enzyme
MPSKASKKIKIKNIRKKRPDFRCISKDVKLGKGVWVGQFVNLYGCTVGDETRIGPFVEIQRGVLVGEKCKIQSHSFICEGVTIGDEVFVGHGVMFNNDRYPEATNKEGQLKGTNDWVLEKTLVKKRASIGTGAVIVSGIIIGEGAMVGAGSVVTKNVADGTLVVGNPARVLDSSK